MILLHIAVRLSKLTVSLMVKDILFLYSSKRLTIKLAAILAGTGVLAIAAIENVAGTNELFWMAAPLFLLWLVDAGYAAEQRRYAEAARKDGGNNDDSAVSPGTAGASIGHFGCAVLSLSNAPFYLALFGLVAFGGQQIAKTNKQAAAEAMHNLSAGAPRLYQTTDGRTMMSVAPPRPVFGQPPANPSLPRFGSAPLPTPQRTTFPASRFTPSPQVPKAPLPSPSATPAADTKNP